jgi:hypothetical protein
MYDDVMRVIVGLPNSRLTYTGTLAGWCEGVERLEPGVEVADLMFNMQGGHWLSVPKRHMNGLDPDSRGQGPSAVIRRNYSAVAVPVVQVGDLFAPSKMSFSNPVSAFTEHVWAGTQKQLPDVAHLGRARRVRDRSMRSGHCRGRSCRP